MGNSSVDTVGKFEVRKVLPIQNRKKLATKWLSWQRNLSDRK